MKISEEQLLAEHTKEAIRARIEEDQFHSTAGDLVLGGVDGTITTFAIVSSVAGTGIHDGALIAFVLGLANVLADGFSMGASNYLKARSDEENVKRYRKIEEIHIDRIPEAEKEEVRQIYERKGFSGEVLENVVETITKDRELWVNTMLTEEWGLQLSATSPLRSGALTFAAFLITGLIPLLPLLLGFTHDSSKQLFVISAVCTAILLLGMGAIRGRFTGESPIRSGFETLAVGGTAAALAYFVGEVLGDLIR